MKKNLFTLFSGLIVALLLCGSFLPVYTAKAEGETLTPTVVTDKPDYSPEEIVRITGYGFTPGMTVKVRVTRPNGVIVSGDGSFDTWPKDYDFATVSDEGGFRFIYNLFGVDGTYLVDVFDTQDTLLSSTSFTDAITNLSVTLNDGSSWTSTSTGEWVAALPGETISVDVTETLSSGSTWRSTQYQIGSNAAVCVNSR
ncbi:MAG: hypothetical protein AB9888_13320 [Bacteroidales bacterium]